MNGNSAIKVSEWERMQMPKRFKVIQHEGAPPKTMAERAMGWENMPRPDRTDHASDLGTDLRFNHTESMDGRSGTLMRHGNKVQMHWRDGTVNTWTFASADEAYEQFKYMKRRWRT